MRNTLSAGNSAPYLGADLTDRYSASNRPIDVCGLWPIRHGEFEARFWTWQWPSQRETLNVEPIAAEIRAARATMLDGPQALAADGQSARVCEQMCRTPGKTPDHLQDSGRPFAGYLRSSVELFAALYDYGLPVSPVGFLGGISEYYPGDAWHRLVQVKLPKKSTQEGRRLRRLIIEILGVVELPDLPSHDQNDACLGALMATAADGRIPELEIVAVGETLRVDSNGTLREGPIATPKPSQVLAEQLTNAIRSAALKTTSSRKSHREPVRPTAARIPPDVLERAQALFHEMFQRTTDGFPTVCTYSHAYERIFNAPASPFSQAYTQKVLDAARATTPMELPGFGWVRLDTFIVTAKHRRPSSGHWSSVTYDCSTWDDLFTNAEVLR